MASYNKQSKGPFFSDFSGQIQPSITFLVLLIGALVAFEMFNFSTTEHALYDMLGNLDFLGLAWSTILAVAFCGIDFAGIARLFSPEQGMDEPKEVWYLFGAWLIAATMNAVLTWWGVSMAVIDHTMKQNSHVIDPQTMINVVPVFVAVLVWLIRILIIGSLSLALDRAIHSPASNQSFRQGPRASLLRGEGSPSTSSRSFSSPRSSSELARSSSNSVVKDRYTSPVNFSPSLRENNGGGIYDPIDAEQEQPVNMVRPEPTYHSLSAVSRPSNRMINESKTDSFGGDHTPDIRGTNRSRRL